MNQQLEHEIQDRRWRSFVICCLLAFLVCAVFGRTIHYEFINYDDDVYIYKNPAITKGLDLAEIGRLLIPGSSLDEWYPITEISHMLAWQFFGSNAGAHHFINVVLHAAVAIFLFLTLQKMTGVAWRSAFVAAVFAIHPLRVESVAWVMERKDVLSGLFFMLALWAWAHHAQRRPGTGENITSALNPERWTSGYGLALVFFIMGLLSKSTVVTLPFVLLLLDYWPLNRSSAEAENSPPLFLRWLWLILEKWPFFLVSAGGCIVTVLSQPDVVTAVHGFSLSWRAGNSLMAYVDYLSHTIYPVGLALVYPRPEEHLPAGRVAVSALILLVITLGAIVLRRKHPCLPVGWFWYLGMLVPVIDIMQTGDQTRADRYTYLPQIGLCIMASWGIGGLFGTSRHKNIVLGGAAALILSSLLAVAYVQASYWKNSISIWTRTLACNPNSYIAHCNLGIALADEGNLSDAVQNFNRALQLNPNDAKSINNLGKVLTSQGKFDDAIQDFDRALLLNSNNVETLNNLGVTLADQGKLDDAIQDLDRVIKLNPNDADACYNLANTLVQKRDFDDAIQYYALALQINPDLPEAQNNLGLTLAREGKVDDAISHYQQAIELKPNDAEALSNLGGVLAAAGKLDESAQYYAQALQLKPNDPNALDNMGVALARQGKLDEAIRDFERAIQLNPNDASAQNNLGIALAGQKKMDEAIQHLQQALSLAESQNNATLEESIRARLKLYQNGSPQPNKP
jgi:tetratricopeptide (TPR) repeat protein